jgi:hypothetical protein
MPFQAERRGARLRCLILRAGKEIVRLLSGKNNSKFVSGTVPTYVGMGLRFCWQLIKR